MTRVGIKATASTQCAVHLGKVIYYMITRNERFLAALIFVLWSFGLVIQPSLVQAGIFSANDKTLTYLTVGYFFLHVVVFLYVGYSLVLLVRAHKRRKYNKYILAMYVYAAFMLLVSMYLIGKQLYA